MKPLAVKSESLVDVAFHPGQLKAWDSKRRIVAITAGTQSGKTSFTPYWLFREIGNKGPGDYYFVTPTFPLLELKALPEFLRLFKQWLNLGEYAGSPRRVFNFSEAGCRRTFGSAYDPDESPPTRVLFGYASDPESLESATAKAAVLDEAGQHKFKVGAWEAILRRLSLSVGRVLITTSVYAMSWLKTRIFDAWQAGDETIEIVRFDSTMNPAFPEKEYERARRDLTRWKFDMLYRGLFTRPAGIIYDVFDRSVHTCPRFAIPRTWRRLMGLDFGTQNTAAVFLAEEPGTKRLYLYRTYHAGGLSTPGHVRQLLHGERGSSSSEGIPCCVGGAASEGEWRDEFRRAGLPVRQPEIRDVELGIDRVYGVVQRNELMVFDDLAEILEELQTYSRAVDEEGNTTAQIEDKASYHLLDALRYLIGKVRPAAPRRARRSEIDWEADQGKSKKGNGKRESGASGPMRSEEEVEQMLMSQ